MADPDEWARHTRQAALLQRLAQELESSQWRTPDEHAAQQAVHLARIVGHARERVPFYANRLAGVELDARGRLDRAAFERIPLLTRPEAQASAERLLATPPPSADGALTQVRTSGSTGTPLTVTVTEREMLHRMALSIRRHRWSGRDATRRLAAIRAPDGAPAAFPHGLALDAWASPVNLLEPTGPMHLLDINTPVSRQLEWLASVSPAYLITYPTNLAALLTESERTGARPAELRQVATMTEAVPEGLREHCLEAWGARLVDNYSSNECGSIASECPDCGAYHAHDEMLLVEILDDEGRPVPPGSMGQVVVTPLFNHATALIRYAIGDHAVRGAPGACARGLTAIERVVGRSRNMLLLPDGDRLWLALGARHLTGDLPIAQFQLAQTALDAIEVRLVTRRPLEAAEEAQLTDYVRGRLPGSYRVTLRYADAIPRGPGLGYEDFVCEIEDRAAASR